MEHYLSINGKKIPLTKEQTEKFAADVQEQPRKVELGTLNPGDCFRIGEHEFIILEQYGDTTSVIHKRLLPDSAFGKTNNYNGSTVELQCNGVANEIAAIIGEDNIVPHKVDMTSNDGLKCYGTIKRRCSLLTADLYRRYVEILDKFKPDSWWWLATPWTTKKHGNESYVLCVSPSGCIFGCNRFNFVGAVRPFCILKSTIFVSK